jgi:hypothetical protein
MSRPDPNPRQPGHNVRVFNCHVAMVHGLTGPKQMGVLTFSRGREILEPFCLSPMQVHVLVRDLIHVLHTLEPSIDRDSDTMVAEPFSSPSIPTAPRSRAKGKSGKGVRPSRNPSAPKGPIQATESWQLHSLLNNVKHHDDFLKFIGAETVADDTVAPAEPADPKDSNLPPIGPLGVEKGEKPIRRRPTRSSQRGKRKEK